MVRKLEKIMPIKVLILLISMGMMAGCQTSSNQGTTIAGSERTVSYQDIGYNPVLSEETAKISRQVQGVDEAIAVVMNKNVSIAVKVTGFDRFRLKEIRQEISKKIKQNLSKQYTVHVTTDKKLFRNLQELKAKLAEGKEPAKALRKSFKKINEDMHG